MTIRPVGRDDVAAISVLYDGLDDTARYRRFFSGFRPSQAFFERLTAISERGGVGLVAVVRGHGDRPERLVGEAGYELLANGNGELAITVDSSWRGWLGPFLLDVLARAAARRGVPNLEADVLTTNGPMLALLRARGHATMPARDWTVVRGVIGTGTDGPTWPRSRGGPRVLVEGAAGHWHANAGAEAAGMQVLCCSGPTRGRPRCPALDGERCPLAAGADMIVIAPSSTTDDWSALRAAHRDVHPGVPVYVERSRGDLGARPAAEADPKGAGAQ